MFSYLHIFRVSFCILFLKTISGANNLILKTLATGSAWGLSLCLWYHFFFWCTQVYLSENAPCHGVIRGREKHDVPASVNVLINNHLSDHKTQTDEVLDMRKIHTKIYARNYKSFLSSLSLNSWTDWRKIIIHCLRNLKKQS